MTLSKIIVTAGVVAALAVPATATAASDGVIIPMSARIGQPIVAGATQPGGKTSHTKGGTNGAKRPTNQKAAKGATTKGGKTAKGTKDAKSNKSTKGTTGKVRQPARPSLIIPIPFTPGSTPQGPRDSDVENCQGYGVDCTDRQFCDIWGMNCDIADRVVVDTKTPEQVESPAPEEAPIEGNTEIVATPVVEDSGDTSSDDVREC